MAFHYLPVYGHDNQLLYHAPIATVPRLLESGRVRRVGSKRRVRALIAVCGAARDELLALARPRAGEQYIHNRETEDNPRGVWAFSRAVAYG